MDEDRATLTRRAAMGVTAGFALGGSAQAQASYPNRPIRLIVCFPPGGVTDVVGRMMADRLAADLGQPVIVDNKAGAAGVIGTEAVAKAPPDGYTLLFTTPNHTINAAFRETMPYDTEKGLPGFEGYLWMCLVALAGTPAAGRPGPLPATSGKRDLCHNIWCQLPEVTLIKREI